MKSDELDPLDRIIVSCLARDGRASGTEISKLLPINEIATRIRLQRLIKSTVSVRALVDPSKFGFPVRAYLGITAQPASIPTIVKRLAAHKLTQYATDCLGAFNIISLAALRSMEGIQQFLDETIAGIEGVNDMETKVCLRTKIGHFWALSAQAIRETDPLPGLDATDIRMVSILAEDGRMSTRQLAKALSVSELTAQRRLKRLIDERIITIRGMVKAHSLGLPVVAYIELSVAQANVQSALTALTKIKQMHVVTQCTGIFNVLCVFTSPSQGDLEEVLRDNVYTVEGVHRVRTILTLSDVRTREAKDAWIVPHVSEDERDTLGDMHQL